MWDVILDIADIILDIIVEVVFHKKRKKGNRHERSVKT